MGRSLSGVKAQAPVPMRPCTDGSLKWNVDTKAVKYKVSCRDSILHGKITLDVNAQSLEYRKSFGLPVMGLGKLAHVFIGGKLTLERDSWGIRPSYSVGLEMRQGGIEVLPMSTVRVKPHLFLGRIGIEVRDSGTEELNLFSGYTTVSALKFFASFFQALTDISIKIPKQLLFESTGGGANPARWDDDMWGARMDLKELNLVLKL